MVGWLGMRERRPWLHAGGLVVFATAVAQLFALLVEQPG